MDRRSLLPHTGITRSARLRDSPSGDYNAHSGFSPQMGSPQENRALDHPNLALRVSHRRACVLDALSVVSPKGVRSILALSR